MRQYFPTLFAMLLVAFLAACGTTNPNYRPQPLAYYPAPAITPEQRQYQSPFEHIAQAHRDMAILRSPTATMEVRWELDAPGRYDPIAKRYNCRIYVRDEFQSVEQAYTCNGIEKSGNDYYILLVTPSGKVERINITEIPGGFVNGGFFEQGMAGLRYGDEYGVLYEVVWRSHQPVRGTAPQWRGY